MKTLVTMTILLFTLRIAAADHYADVTATSAQLEIGGPPTETHCWQSASGQVTCGAMYDATTWYVCEWQDLSPSAYEACGLVGGAWGDSATWQSARLIDAQMGTLVDAGPAGTPYAQCIDVSGAPHCVTRYWDGVNAYIDVDVYWSYLRAEWVISASQCLTDEDGGSVCDPL